MNTPDTLNTLCANIDHSRRTLDQLDPRLHHWPVEVPEPYADGWFTACTHQDCSDIDAYSWGEDHDYLGVDWEPQP